MALILAAIAIIGAIIGFRFRAPAIIAATLCICLTAAGGILLEQPLMVVLLRALYLIVSLQVGYLIGLAWTTFRHR